MVREVKWVPPRLIEWYLSRSDVPKVVIDNNGYVIGGLEKMQANSVNKNDEICISFVGNDQGRAINRSFNFSGDGTQYDKKGNPNGGRRFNVPVVRRRGKGDKAPEFPMIEYVNLTTEGRHAEAQALSDEYQRAFRDFQAKGGDDIGSLLIDAAINFLREEMGVGTPGNAAAEWNIERGKITLNIPERKGENDPVVWVIQPAPVWGVGFVWGFAL